MVQNKNTRERRIMVKKFHAGGRMSGEIEDVTVDEIASRFPLVTMDALLEVEEKLNMKQYNKSMVIILHIYVRHKKNIVLFNTNLTLKKYMYINGKLILSIGRLY